MHAKKIDEHSEKVRIALKGGGQDRIDSQHEKGKLTARERISILADEGSFVEIDSMATHHYHDFDMQKKIYPGHGVVGGYAKISGRQVYVYAYDFTILGGTLSQMGAKKITKLMDHASRNGKVNYRNNGFGRTSARQERIHPYAIDGFADLFLHVNQIMIIGALPLNQFQQKNPHQRVY